MAIPKRKPDDFTTFLQQREAAAAAYVAGDGAPVARIAARHGDATFFPPTGGSVEGAAAVAARYAKDVHAFAPGGTSRLDVLQSQAAGDLAFWTGFQTAHVTINGKPIDMKLRITEIFRLEDDGWKMIHRHADTSAGEKS